VSADERTLHRGAARTAAPPAWWGTRGWRIVGALSITETVSWGILYYAFAVFLIPMQRELGAILERPLLTLERVRVCKLDGERFAEPRDVPATDATGLGIWTKLMVYAGEQSRFEGLPLNQQLVRALRRAGAAGATSLRGVWGYHGDHAPHGDSFWQLRRRVPVVTVIVDTPERIRDWFAIVDEITSETGLVTSETVPAYRATGPDLRIGGTRLAQRTP
jgi:PII-like signaling protein